LAELNEVFEAAKLKLPGELRARVGDVKLAREKDLGVGKEAPLEYRLLNRAAYASFSILDRTLTVYDAGASEGPVWDGGRGAREDLAVMMLDVADVLGVNTPRSGEDVDLDLAWEKFVKRVWSWSDTPVPDPLPEVGDGAVFTQFLKDGVRRAMGGEASMEQLMVHEFGHALQLEQETMGARMSYWGHLSGFTNSKRGEPSDGFVGGSNRMEQMKVLIRLLLSNEPKKMSRGGLAEYQVSDKANFVNRYARYDLREDYAESFRLMTYDPERLIKVAPEKFL
jgi:hypothetical protein